MDPREEKNWTVLLRILVETLLEIVKHLKHSPVACCVLFTVASACSVTAGHSGSPGFHFYYDRHFLKQIPVHEEALHIKVIVQII